MPAETRIRTPPCWRRLLSAEPDGDPVRISQALTNLVDNALKYTPDRGRVTLAVAKEPGAVTVMVSDNGPGVPLGERKAIWRRLYRGDASRSQRGLGLTLVRAVAEAHGGRRRSTTRRAAARGSSLGFPA